MLGTLIHPMPRYTNGDVYEGDWIQDRIGLSGKAPGRWGMPHVATWVGNRTMGPGEGMWVVVVGVIWWPPSSDS